VKRSIIAALTSLLIASGALAVVVPDDGTDSFGVYFEDAEGNLVNTTYFESGETTMYLILAGMTAPSIAAWEVALDFDSSLGEITHPGLAGNGINWGAPEPNFIVGLPVSLLPDEDGNVVLAACTFELLVPGAVIPIYAGPATPASIPGIPIYLNGEDLFELIPMSFSVDMDGQGIDEDGWTIYPIAGINTEGGVATENATWSSVKNLYR
jgi:hypothetical protein